MVVGTSNVLYLSTYGEQLFSVSLRTVVAQCANSSCARRARSSFFLPRGLSSKRSGREADDTVEQTSHQLDLPACTVIKYSNHVVPNWQR